MAKVMGRSRPHQEGVGTSMKMSETGIFIVLGIIGLLALKFYFIDYRHSPGYVLGEYIGAIKSGNIETQYGMIDDSDKKIVTSQKQYEKACKWASGYTERITGSNFTAPVPDPERSQYRHNHGNGYDARAGRQRVDGCRNHRACHRQIRPAQRCPGGLEGAAVQIGLVQHAQRNAQSAQRSVVNRVNRLTRLGGVNC